MRHFLMDKDAIDSVSRKALIMMSQHKIPISPENYSVWFDYFSGFNKALGREIDQIINKNGKFSEEINDSLYKKYFGKDANLRLIEDAHKGIQKILKDVLEEILITQETTADYHSKLNNFTKQLDEATDLHGVRHIVANLVISTVEVIQAGEKIKAQMEETTKTSKILKLELEKAQEEIFIDPLTGLHNRRAFDRKIEEYMNLFHDEGTFFSIVMIDIDHFRQFNDQHGHLLGDYTLKFVGSLLLQELKGRDFVARYGGEEFVILLEDTSIANTYSVADNIRKRLDGIKLQHVKTGEIIGKVTISAGVTSIQNGDTIESLVQRADNALYCAKQDGRNNVKSDQDLTPNIDPKKRRVPSAVKYI
jgi:diguanylate cyclase